MEALVTFFRDKITGFTYFVYALVIIFLIFAIIGYFVTQKYQSSKDL